MRWRKLSFRRERDERDLDEEIRFYLAEEARLRMERGESLQSARESAQRDFGNLTLVKEITREMWGWHSVEMLLQDLSYGLRQLRRNPGFTVVAVVMLALGIGANTAIFSIVNSFLLRPLPVKDAGQLTVVSFQQKNGPLLNQFSYPDFEDIRRQSSAVFADVFGYQIGLTGLRADGKTGRMWINYVTGNYFAVLGVQPTLGRLILPSEGQQADADPVLVLGHSYWQQRFGADPNIVGKRVFVNGRPFTIIGVGPAKFHGISSLFETQGYAPLGMAAMETSIGDFLHDRAQRNLSMVARLKPGVSVQQAQAQLSVVARRVSDQYPKTDEGLVLRLFREREARPEPDSTNAIPMIAALFLFLAALVLLLACINVANLLLVRATARQRETAVRAALGASRTRLARQLLTESLLLGILGGASGIFLGIWASTLLRSIDFRTAIPFMLDFSFDWNVFAFACGIAVLTGCVVGIVPATRHSRGNLADVLRSGGRAVAAGRHRLRSTLVVIQVSGSLMLLIVAALFMRSLENAQRTDLGFDPDHVINLIIDANEAGYSESQGREFARTLLERVRAMPGVESASLAFSVPMGYYSSSDILHIAGYQPPADQLAPVAEFNIVTPGYFETLRIPILRGRAFTDADAQASQHVAVINEAMAQQFWPGRGGVQNAIGRRFQMREDAQHSIEVVGIARNSRVRGFRSPIRPYFYVPLAQTYISVQTLQVRTAEAPEAALADVQRLIETIAPGMPLLGGQTMNQGLNTLVGFQRYRIGAVLAAALGMLGLLLAVVGVYGVVSYSAAQRTHEIGIRMALGAQPRGILSMIVRQGLVIVGGGLAIGLLATFVLARLVSKFLVGVSGTDPLILGAVTVLLGLVAVAACYVPARRATRIDPVVALHVE